MDTETMMRALADVRAERERQHARWGQQDLPDGTGIPATCDALARLPSRLAIPSERQQQANVAALDDGSITYAGILLEEVLEALEEDDPERLRAELVQVAAVAVQWVETLDRRKKGGR